MVSVIPSRAIGPRFELLDLLRFLAAFAVVGYHWMFRGIETGSIATLSYVGASEVASYGYLGVELFFLISGFVIALSARGRKASEFVVRRGVRLYPAFWAAVLITAAVAAAWGAPQFAVTPIEVLANLTMVPNVFNQPLVDAVYWTLFYEVIFYGMIFVFLLLGLGRWLDAFFPAWALGMVAIALVVPQFSNIYLLGGLFAFFAAGAIISTIQRNGWHWWQALGLVASFYIAIRYTIGDVARINAADSRPFDQSTIITCLIVAAMFVIMLIQIHPRVAAWVIPRSVLLGALTYPVYLLHAHLSYIFFNHFANDLNRWWMYGVALLLVLVLAYVVHVFVERRPKRFWLRWFDLVVGTPVRWAEQHVNQLARVLNATLNRSR